MSKDQSYGFLILLISAIVLIAYLTAFFGPILLPATFPRSWYEIAVGFPVLLAVLLALGIMGWIGYTMMTTPPPTPLEDITSTPTETKAEEGKKG